MQNLITGQKFALIKGTGRGLEVETYGSKLGMVLDLMSNGSLGGGSPSYFGSSLHWAALLAIEKRLVEVRRLIAEEERQEK